MNWDLALIVAATLIMMPALLPVLAALAVVVWVIVQDGS